MNKNFYKSKVVVSTHFLIYSASQALRDYLKKEGATVLYISHPLPGVNPDPRERSYAQLSKGEKILQENKAFLRFNSVILSVIYETLQTIRFIFSTHHQYDLFIGVDNMNALNGLLLKKLGKVKKVVYYTIDYFPTRYKNNILNGIYHAIDKFCVRYADETWNVSGQMIIARQKHNHMNPNIYNRQYTVPIGIWYDSAPRKPFAKINKRKIVFVGHLVKHMGVDLIIEALPKIRKRLSGVTVDIIGGGEELSHLQLVAKKYNMEKYITFWNWIREREKLEEIMSDGAIGLATFNTKILDEKVKNADPGKIKDYMLLGMPVIVTDAISTGKQITKAQAGIVIPYDSRELTHAVIQLLSNSRKLQTYRTHALRYIHQFDYAKIFKPNLKRVLA